MSKTLIINTITAWDEPHRARHQLTFALAKKNYHLVFVARNEKGSRKVENHRVSDNITLIVPHFPVDYRFRYRLPLLNEHYQNWLFSQLAILYPGVPVVNFDFTAHRIFNYFREVIYYCNDEYIGNSKYPNWLVNTYHKHCEKKVISKSVFNVTTAPYLTQKLQKLNRHTYEILLGVNAVELPAGFKGIRLSDSGVIRLGLMGVINERQISLKLINKLVDDPSFELVLIGPVEEAFLRGIRQKDKVIKTGVLKGQALVNELMSIDIGLALYNLKRINPGTSPNKLWQYLSVGKPAIVSRIPNIREELFPEDSVFLYDENEDIKGLILKANTLNSEDKAQERIDFSRKHTWDQRANEFEVLIERYLKK